MVGIIYPLVEVGSRCLPKSEGAIAPPAPQFRRPPFVSGVKEGGDIQPACQPASSYILANTVQGRSFKILYVDLFPDVIYQID